MKVALFGYGSIGKRHGANFLKLYPDAQLIVADPIGGDGVDYPRWSTAIKEHEDINAVIVASPTDEHMGQIATLSLLKIAYYLEKPPVALKDFDGFADGVVKRNNILNQACAVGFQYRFHPAIARLRALAATENVLRFYARDNLLARYGADVAGIMASHAIDLALWLLGPALRVELTSDGVALTGHIQHQGGASMYDYRMDAPQRRSYVTVRGERVDLPADEGMYLQCLSAWVNWVKGGERDSRTATLANGLSVERVLRSVQP